MKKTIVIIFFLSFITIPSIILCNQYATTDLGKRVVLKDDGTWEFVKKVSAKDFKYDFRKTQWEMNIEQVKKTEESPVLYEGWSDVDDATIINYKEKVFLYACHITYLFDENRLFQGKYIFDPNKEEDNLFISDYQKIKEALIDKYGDPIEDNITWIDSLYIEENQKWGYAIKIEHLKYTTTFETKRTIIMLHLFGNENSIILQIDYNNKKYKSDEL